MLIIALIVVVLLALAIFETITEPSVQAALAKREAERSALYSASKQQTLA
jgi:hypothetical protein